MFINALKTRNRRTALTIPDGDGQNIETETFDEPHFAAVFQTAAEQNSSHG